MEALHTKGYHQELSDDLKKKVEKIFAPSKNKKEGYKEYINGKNGRCEYITLHKFIRHKIHHPENTLDKTKYTEKELEKSIKYMRDLLL